MLAGKQATAATRTTAMAPTMLATAASGSTAIVIATTFITTTATAAMTEQASVGLLFTAHKGDTDNREKNRDATKNKPIHPRILQKDLQVP